MITLTKVSTEELAMEHAILMAEGLSLPVNKGSRQFDRARQIHQMLIARCGEDAAEQHIDTAYDVAKMIGLIDL